MDLSRGSTDRDAGGMRQPRTPRRATPSDVEHLLQHEDFVRRFARGLTADEHLAEDAAQDAWAYALTHGPTHTAGLRGWLSRIVHSSTVSRCRAESARRYHESRSASDRAPDGVPPGGVDAGALELDSVQLAAAVHRLPEHYRRVIELRYSAGLSLAEVAERLAVPLQTVKTRQRRALERLRDQLDPRGRTGSRLQALVVAALRPWAALGPARAAVLATLFLALSFSLWRALAPDRPDRPDRSGRAGAPEDPAIASIDRPRPLEAETRAVGAGPVERAPLPATGPARAAELVVRARWRDTGLPVAGLEVLCEPEAGGEATRALTDDGGEVRFADLARGNWTVSPWLGDSRRTSVSPGTPTVCELSVPRGVSVAGRTLGMTHGAPIADAELWVSFPDRVDVGREVGQTAADGSFLVEGIDPRSWLGAVDGDVPRSSELVRAGSVAGGASELALPVADRLVELARGVVTDPSGAPIAGADVRVPYRSRRGNDPVEHPRIDSDGRSWVRSPRASARTDSTGAFVLTGIRLARPFPVEAHAPGFVSGAVMSTARTRPLELTLGRGARVAGRVEGPDGRPVAAAEVHVTWPGAASPKRVVADGDGAYALDGVPGREVLICAFGKDELGLPLSESSTVELSAGETLRWDPHLAAGHGIVGELVDSAGTSLADWVVSLSKPTSAGTSGDRPTWSAVHARTISDGAGRFAFAGVFEAGQLLEASPPGHPDWVLARAIAGPADAREATPVRLEAHVARSAGVTLRGRLVDPATGSAPTDPCTLALRSMNLRSALEVQPSPSGHFTLGPLPPGEFELHLAAPGAPSVRLTRGVATEDTDLGELHPPAAATLRVWIHAPGEEDRIDAHLTIMRHDGIGLRFFQRRRPVPATSGWLELQGLPPGHYRLIASAADRATTSVPVELEPGDADEVRIGLAPGVPIDLEVQHSPVPGATCRIDVEILTEDGGGVLQLDTHASPTGDPFRKRLLLGEGTYDLLVRLHGDAGLRSESKQRFAVDARRPGELVTVVLD